MTKKPWAAPFLKQHFLIPGTYSKERKEVFPMTLSFTFINPNPPEAVERILRAILLEKLTADPLPGEPPAAG